MISVRARIATAFVTVAVAVVVTAAAGYVSTSSALGAGALVDHTLEVLRELEGLQGAVAEAKDQGGATLLLRQRIDRHLVAAERFVRDNPLQAQRIGELRALLDGPASPSLFRKVDELCAAMRGTEQQLLSSRSEAAARHGRLALWTILGGAVVALLVSVAAVVRLTRAVESPVLALLRAADALGRGELSSRVEVGGNAEFVRLAQAFNAMAARRQLAEATMREARDEATLALKELDSFSHSVSHDLRAPLRTVDGFARALWEDFGQSLPPEAQRHLERIRAGAQKMSGLIDALLGLSRVTRQELRRERTDLSSVCRESFEQSHPGATAELRCQPDVTADADPKLVRVIMDNLVGNALKYSQKKPRAEVEFGVREEGVRRVYFVRDNGAGFDMRYADKLFVAFQRLHPTAEFEGTGIGLATVFRAVARHGGRIWAESKVGEGATFFFTLGRETEALS